MIEGETKSGPAAARATGGGTTAARRRAALEMVARYEQVLKRTARRYSLDAEDVEDAFQRALEIVLTKAPTTDSRELIRWTQTVIKHEALAVRRNRERLLGSPPQPTQASAESDPVALLPARGEGPEERAERREDVARVREALQTLKPAELRALTLLAEGYSYAEIADITGFSLTKINRLLAEGRERFRTVLRGSESGERCRQLQALISSFCDGEASPRDAATVREHLRACAHCRATMRTYRTAPRLASALVPVALLRRSLLERARELVSSLGSHLGAAKGAALCAGVAGTAAAGIVTGAVPSPFAAGQHPGTAPVIERKAKAIPARPPRTERAERHSRRRVKPQRAHHANRNRSAEARAQAEPVEAVEYETPPEAPQSEPVAPPPAPEPSASSGSAAGEFGP